ncbi:MAG: toprim domain-containing protein [Candidatus Rokubacteria bacterium]|nr:toprim domain-containing protein [Candidatus Rokubacteria bacterium]
MLHRTPDFKDLKRHISIEHVLAHRGLLNHMQRQGDRLMGCCPIHHGDSPTAFVVSQSKNLWWCFTGCQAGGDVVELVRRLDQCSYPEVARHLATLADVLPPAAAHTAPAPRRFQPFTRTLPIDHSSAWLQHKRIRPETARTFEAGCYHGGGFLSGCVAVRLHDPDGAPLGYAGRRLDPNEIRAYGKWKLPPTFPRSQILFGFHRIRPSLSRGLVLVECPWGVMRLAQLGIPAVALLGTHASDIQERMLALAPILVLLMDGDPAGRRAAVHLQQRLDDHCDVHLASLPDGCDPDDLSDDALAATLRQFPLAQPQIHRLP